MSLIRRETGILKKVKADGRETFFTVERVYFLGVYMGLNDIYRDEENMLCENNIHYSLHSAQQTIDQHLRDIELEKQKKLDKKIVKKEFIKYP